MAIFGVPQSHEDDPVRAIKAAGEIHDLVDSLSPELEEKISQPLSMHSGINTGLAVTGEFNPELGTHSVSGDALNLASRLSDQAGAGEILVGYNTYHRAEGYFSFQVLEPTTVKGKAEPISVYKVLSEKDKPGSMHRSSTKNQRRTPLAISEYVLGMIYSQIAAGPMPKLSILAKNVGFLVKNVPFASKKAEEHYQKAIELTEEIGAHGCRGISYLELGRLHQAKKKTDKARQYIARAIEILEECKAEQFLQKAKEALTSQSD